MQRLTTDCNKGFLYKLIEKIHPCSLNFTHSDGMVF